MKLYGPSIYILFVFFSKSIFAQINLGFEDGTFNGWKGSIMERSLNVNLEIPGAVENGLLQHCIMSASMKDPLLPFLEILPPGKNHSARVGNTEIGGHLTSLTQTFKVDSNNMLLTYHYSVVLEGPIDEFTHMGLERPHFVFNIYDKNKHIISCFQYYILSNDNLSDFNIACITEADSKNSFKNIGCPSGADGYDSSIVNTSLTNIISDTGCGNSWHTKQLYYTDWKSNSEFLNEYLGEEITIEFIASDCMPKGHRSYAYVYAETNSYENSFPPLMIHTNIESKTLSAPAGFNNYVWKGPVGGIIGNQDTSSISIIKAGTYEVNFEKIYDKSCTHTLLFEVKEDTSIITNNSIGTFSSDIRAYPNPTKEHLIVEVLNPEKFKFSITDLLGKEYPLNLTLSYNSAIINLRELPLGPYFIRLKSKESVNFIRIMKE